MIEVNEFLGTFGPLAAALICTGVMLEQQLQPELNVARVAGGGDPAEGWGAEKVVREIEVRVVEEVEGFGPEL